MPRQITPAVADEPFEIKTGQETIADDEMVIVPTPTGLWKIETKGISNRKLKICSETFTSLIFARQALEKYKIENSTRLFHKARIQNKEQ